MMSVLVVLVVVAVIFASMAEAKKKDMNLMEDIKTKSVVSAFLREEMMKLGKEAEAASSKGRVPSKMEVKSSINAKAANDLSKVPREGNLRTELKEEWGGSVVNGGWGIADMLTRSVTKTDKKLSKKGLSEYKACRKNYDVKKIHYSYGIPLGCIDPFGHEGTTNSWGRTCYVNPDGSIKLEEAEYGPIMCGKYDGGDTRLGWNTTMEMDRCSNLFDPEEPQILTKMSCGPRDFTGIVGGFWTNPTQCSVWDTTHALRLINLPIGGCIDFNKPDPEVVDGLYSVSLDSCNNVLGDDVTAGHTINVKGFSNKGCKSADQIWTMPILTTEIFGQESSQYCGANEGDISRFRCIMEA